MLDLMPKKLIQLSNLNNWSIYSPGLKNFSYVKKYFENIFKKWVNDLENPLEMRWIQSLYNRKIGYLNEDLLEFEKMLGEENLFSILREIESEGGKSEALSGKVDSIFGEIRASQILNDLGIKNIYKIHEIGDWESDDSIISVKSISDYDSQYRQIEQIIKGLIFIDENSILREYNQIFLFKSENLNYHFLSFIYDYLRESFVEAIMYVSHFCNKKRQIPVSYPDFLEIKQYSREFLVEINFFPNYDEYEIRFRFSERQKNVNCQTYELNIKLSKDYSQPETIYIHYDTDTYYEGCELDLKKLKNICEPHISSFNSEYKKTEKEFIGLIIIPISPNHELFILDKLRSIKEDFTSLKSNDLYKTIICFFPNFRFELKEPIWFEL